MKIGFIFSTSDLISKQKIHSFCHHLLFHRLILCNFIVIVSYFRKYFRCVFLFVPLSHSFLNSCVNPVALYCVSGVFRQHFHRYLCCKQIPIPRHPLGMSSATGVCDTSFTSTIRRINTHHGNNNIFHNGSSPTQSIILSEKR